MASAYSFSLLHAGYVQLDQHWNYKNVISPFYRLYYIEEGNGWLYTPDLEITLESNCLYLIPAYTLFNQGCTGYLSQYFIHFLEETATGNSLFTQNRKLFKITARNRDLESMKRLIALHPNRDLKESYRPDSYDKGPLLHDLLERNKAQPIALSLETEALIMELLSRFMVAEVFDEAPHPDIPAVIPEALNYIGTHLAAPLTVSALAKRANLSIDYFSKLFYRKTGERPILFIQRKRIERAQFLLITTNMSLSAIAAETGLADSSYFSRLFKRLTGYTPAGYKKLNIHY